MIIYRICVVFFSAISCGYIGNGIDTIYHWAEDTNSINIIKDGSTQAIINCTDPIIQMEAFGDNLYVLHYTIKTDYLRIINSKEKRLIKEISLHGRGHILAVSHDGIILESLNTITYYSKKNNWNEQWSIRCKTDGIIYSAFWGDFLVVLMRNTIKYIDIKTGYLAASRAASKCKKIDSININDNKVLILFICNQVVVQGPKYFKAYPCKTPIYIAVMDEEVVVLEPNALTYFNPSGFMCSRKKVQNVQDGLLCLTKKNIFLFVNTKARSRVRSACDPLNIIIPNYKVTQYSKTTALPVVKLTTFPYPIDQTMVMNNNVYTVTKNGTLWRI